MNYFIENDDDITHLQQHNSWLNRPYIHGIEVKLTGINPHERVQYEKQVKRLFNDCGCGWGALIFLLTLPSCYLLISHSTAALWTEISASIFTAIVFGFFAKLMKLKWSQVQLREILLEISSHIVNDK